ncbi:MAG: bifunctional methylenetetrahydrofolate dehydrogenase/methenyltetrahydrofolate cyclohydrolase FolD [bacterium]
MSAQIINGKNIAAEIREEVRADVDRLVETFGRPPGLAVILVGCDPASEVYVRNKRKACADSGIVSVAHDLPSETSQTALLELVDSLNNDDTIDGILVQLPLPQHINTETIIEAINPEKDVDGFHPYNIGRLAVRMPRLRSCTPYGVIELLNRTGEVYKGRNAVVVGASNHVGRPMALELMLAGATVTVCHRFTADSASHAREADILIAAAGRPHLVKGDWVKEGATVIDVGIHRTESGTLIGDVDFETARERAAWITPVPGGVGPMTVAMLMKNTLISYRQRMTPQ